MPLTLKQQNAKIHYSFQIHKIFHSKHDMGFVYKYKTKSNEFATNLMTWITYVVSKKTIIHFRLTTMIWDLYTNIKLV